MRRQPPIVLASASPRRAQLLQALGWKFTIRPGDVEEPACSHLTPREIAIRHAFAKAQVVAKRFRSAVVIGADTIVVLGGTIFGKPRDLQDARRMLGRLQGRTHHVITGVCVLQRSRHKKLLFSETTDVKFRKLTQRQVSSYLQRINPLDKAGAYAIQEFGEEVVERIEGSWCNVVGFPIEAFLKRVRRAGIL